MQTTLFVKGRLPQPTATTFERATAGIAIAMGVAALANAAWSAQSDISELADGFELTALAGAALLLTTGAGFRENLLVVALLAIGVSTQRFLSLNSPVFVMAAEAAAVGCAVCLGARRAIRNPGQGQTRVLWLGLALALGPLAASTHVNALTGPGWACDPAIFNFDQQLGVRIPSLLSLAIGVWPPLHGLVEIGYASTPAFMACADRLAGLRQGRMSSVAAFIASAAIGAVCYHFTPAIGNTFPDNSYLQSLFSTDPRYAQGYVDVLHSTPRSTVPSLHATWGLFLLWRVQDVPRAWGRAAIASAGLVQLVGALTIGQHWLLDIAIAVPFAFALNTLFRGARSDRTPAVLCACVALLWFLALRNFSFVDIGSWTARLSLAGTAAAPWLARLACRFAQRASAARHRGPVAGAPRPALNAHVVGSPLPD